MNTVRERLRDAEALLNAGRRDGALFMVLLAALATARKRFPNTTDEKRFIAFIEAETPKIVLSPIGAWEQWWSDGKTRSLAQILWGIARCGMAHEGSFGAGFAVSAAKGWLVQIPTPGTMILSEGVLRRIVRVVAMAPENGGELAGFEFWAYATHAWPSGESFVFGEDWISGGFDVPLGISMTRAPEPLRVAPGPNAEPGSLVLRRSDGGTLAIP